MTSISTAMPDLPRRLNRECFCITLDEIRLTQALEARLRDVPLAAGFLAARPHLFSNTPVFLSGNEIARMRSVVDAVEEAAAHPAYRAAVLAWAPRNARHDPGPRGAFMGYDFHLTAQGPKLIEINTNAGGAFLNAMLVGAQRSCCVEVDEALTRSGGGEFDAATIAMFENEWRLQRGSGRPKRIAIVDDRPEEQYLYPELLLAQHLFIKHGIEARVVDAAALRYAGGRLWTDDKVVDLVYNRLVDFPLEAPDHAALRAAWLDGAAVVTPNPRNHALYADKRNLTVLSDRATLKGWGLSGGALAALECVPRTVLVTAENATQLWRQRKTLFFKPVTGYGSKAVYRGDKLTKGVWGGIAEGGYVAQDFAAPGERMIELDGMKQPRKADVRLYVYDGRLLLAAARLYQGQATNLRTPGGGFAPLLAL